MGAVQPHPFHRAGTRGFLSCNTEKGQIQNSPWNILFFSGKRPHCLQWGVTNTKNATMASIHRSERTSDKIAWSRAVWIHNCGSAGNSRERQVPTVSYP